MYIKKKVNKLAFNFYDPSPYWAKAGAKYETGLKVTRVLGAIEGVEVIEKPYMEVFSFDIEVDPPAIASTPLLTPWQSLSSFFLLNLVRPPFLWPPFRVI